MFPFVSKKGYQLWHLSCNSDWTACLLVSRPWKGATFKISFHFDSSEWVSMQRTKGGCNIIVWKMTELTHLQVMRQGYSKVFFRAGISKHTKTEEGALGKNKVQVIHLGWRRSSFAHQDYKHWRQPAIIRWNCVAVLWGSVSLISSRGTSREGPRYVLSWCWIWVVYIHHHKAEI